jgi:hypothetical protein
LYLETAFSRRYAEKVASVVAGPGISPNRKPTIVPRPIGAQERRISWRVGSISRIRTRMGLL